MTTIDKLFFPPNNTCESLTVSNSVCKVLTRENEEDSVIEGLWAAGETACVSVHGANRLGANSLLELMVFGKAIADQIDCMSRPGERHEDLPAVRFTISRCFAILLSTRNAWHGMLDELWP